MAHDLANQRFGRLLVIRKSDDEIQKKSSSIMWHCVCDCKKEKDVRSSDLLNGRTQSCGCLHKEIISTHKLPQDRLYKVWIDMRSRCNNPKIKCYKNYGGRGIKICSEWDKYENFEKWSKNNGYSETLTIDRIDVNGNYEPNNCRWLTKKEQENNRRNNIFDYYNGQKTTLSQLAEILNIRFARVSYLYHNKNMSFDEISEYILQHESECIGIDDKSSSIYYSNLNGIRHSDLLARIRRLIKNNTLQDKIDITNKYYKTKENQYRHCF